MRNARSGSGWHLIGADALARSGSGWHLIGADALAAALRKLCLDRELHARCRANIETRLHSFSWENRGLKIAEFVRKLGD